MKFLVKNDNKLIDNHFNKNLEYSVTSKEVGILSN
jgi:hypothetical protein